MKVVGIKEINYNRTSFERRLTKEEEKSYKKDALKPAFEYLGTKEVAMILHGTSYPETNFDIGVGSPYGEAARKIIPFEMLHGFNSNQLGPVGVISDAQHISPYKSTILTKNYLFIDFAELTKDKYANILSKDVIKSVFNKPVNNNQNFAYSDFAEAFANYDYCIKIANNNFKTKIANKDPNALRLNQEFKRYKNDKKNVVFKEALFNILAKTYNTSDFHKWNDEDRNLIQLLKQRNPEAIERYKKLIHRSKEDFEAFVFGQFIIDKQIKENTKYRKALGFKYISDFLVGVSPADEWANQNLFLKDYRMGCPHGGPYGPQLWDIPVLDPNKLFKSENDLGEAGIYLKNKLEACLNNFDNVRIDHALGLIDPYIYKKDSVNIVDGKIDLSKFVGNNISHIEGLDSYGNYKRILEKIILPTLKEHCMDKNYPVWEDLCAETEVFKDIYHKKLKLPGLTQLEWMRGEQYQHTKNWGLVGSHDSDPAQMMIKKDWVKNDNAWNIFYLAGFLNSNPARAEYRDEFCKQIANNDMDRVKAKFAELFLSSQKVQISFADFLGINKTYNKGGSENDLNWKLRLNKDFEDYYYKNLSSDKPTAINMPEILKIAVQAKADKDFVQKANELGLPHAVISSENAPEVQHIIDNLDKYEKILKE